METYNKKIATNDQVELIHVSLDLDEEPAIEWAKTNTFPWPTVLNKNAKESGLMKYEGPSVPHYALIDKNGTLITEGKLESFEKIKELSK